MSKRQVPQTEEPRGTLWLQSEACGHPLAQKERP